MSKDWERWRDGKIWKKFERRDGCICTRTYTYSYSYDDLVRRGYHDNESYTNTDNGHFGLNTVGSYDRYDRATKDRYGDTIYHGDPDHRYGARYSTGLSFLDCRNYDRGTCFCVDN
ncbi:unnamed protein product, partial [Rotaria sp. Silwood1]